MRTEDGYIIHKCLDGDSAAFGLLVDKYRESIYGLAYSKLGDFHDAEDVTQEVFIKAYQKLRTLKRWDSFLAWLYSITSNLCKDWIRRRSRQPDREFIEDKDSETLKALSMDSYRREHAFESLREALESLPEMYRQVLILYHLSGMSGKEIARFLGISPNTVRQRLWRARARLKEEMLAMISETLEGQKLKAGFTFRILEAVKRIRIDPAPRITALPWGLPLATGIIIGFLCLPYFPGVSTDPITFRDMEIPELAEIPVNIMKISQTSVVPGYQGHGDGQNRSSSGNHNAPLLAPGAEERAFPEEPAHVLGRGNAQDAVYSPDGKLVAIGGSTGVWLRKADDLAEIGLLEGHTAMVTSVAFSSDGKVLASGDNDGIIRIWDVEKREETAVLSGHTGHVLSLSFGPDGKLLASGGGFRTWNVGTDEKMVRIWDVEQKKQIAELSGHDGIVCSVSFSPDGTLVASACHAVDKTVRIWGVEQKKVVALLEHPGNVRSVSFSPDGKLLATAGWEPVQTRIWNVEEMEVIAMIPGIPPVLFSPDGKLFAFRSPREASTQVWDVETMREVARLPGYGSLSFSPDGKRILQLVSNAVRVWDIAEEKEVADLDYTGYVYSVSFSPDGKLLAYGGADIRILDVESRKEIVYKGGKGPDGFKPEEMAQTLARLCGTWR